jgi:Toastrack DUF4097
VKPLLLLLLTLGFLTATSAAALEQKEFSSNYPLRPGGTLSVENVQGKIEVEGWDRPEVEMSVTKSTAGTQEDLDEVRVVVESSAGALALHTLYPQDSGEPVKVDYHLRVPRQLLVDRLRTVYGDIAVHGVEGENMLRTLNGSIEVGGTSGRLLARAVNGAILASPRSLPDSGNGVMLETLSGDVVIALPPHANADLHLSTVAGKILGSYVFQASNIPGDSTREARVGRGGATIKVRTVKGNIRVFEQDDQL